MCCLLPEYVCGQLFFFFVPLPPTCTIRESLCYVVALLSIPEEEPEYVRQEIGLSTKDVSEGMEPSSIDPLCGEGKKKPFAETLWPLFLSSTVVFFHQRTGCFFMWAYLQSCASLPTKPAQPQYQQVLTKGLPPNWGRNPLISSLLIFLSASCFYSCFAQAPGNSPLLKNFRNVHVGHRALQF